MYKNISNITFHIRKYIDFNRLYIFIFSLRLMSHHSVTRIYLSYMDEVLRDDDNNC